MAVVGSAEVIVRAVTSKVKDDIVKAFKDARPAIAAEGEEASKSYLDGFKKNLNRDMGEAVRDAFNSPEISRAAGEGGQQAGNIFGNAVKDEVSKTNLGDALSNPMADAMNRLEEEVRTDTDKVGQDTEDRLRNAGDRGGKGFVEGFLKSDFANAASAASSELTGLIVKGNLLGPAISALVTALSSAASGLFAMGAAAGQAAGALGVLPGLMAAALQGAGGLKLAFAGVSKAIQAGFKDSSAISTGGKAAATAAYAVADAREALAKANQSAGDAQVDANRRVADAEDNLKSAQKDLTQAQKDLTAAHAAGREELQQLAFSAEEAALGQQRAGLRLEDARAKLVAAQNLPVDDRGRREAELNFKEAELAYRESKDRNNDLRKEQKKAAKDGVNGTKAVSDARKKVADAEKRRNDAAKAVDQAKLQRARQERDSAQAIADAVERLRRAQEAANDATKKGTSTANAYKTALNQLGKPQQEFVKYVVSLKDEFKNLKSAAGQNLFGPLTSAMKDIVKNVFPILSSNLKDTGGLLGDAAKGMAQVFNPRHGKAANRLNQVMKGNNDILKIFTQRGKGGENTFSKLERLALRLLKAVNPLTKTFARWVKGLIDGAEKSTRSHAAMTKLTNFFNNAGKVAAKLGHIFHNLWDIIHGLGKAAVPAGNGLLNSFSKATGQLAKFINTPKQQKTLTQFFKDAGKNLRGIGKLITAIGGDFLSMGNNKGIGKLATGLIPAVHNLRDMGDNLDKSSPSLAGLAVNATKLLKALTSGGGLTKFIDNLSTMVGWLADAASSKFGQKILTWAGYISAFTHTIGFLIKPLKFLGLGLAGGPIKAMRAWMKLRGFFKTFRTDGLVAALKGLGKGSDQAKDAFERQMKTDKAKIEMLAKLEAQAKQTTHALLNLREAGLPASAAAEKAAGGKRRADVEVDSPSQAGSADKGAADESKKAGKKAADKAKKPSVLSRARAKLASRKNDEGGFVDLTFGAKNAEKATKDSTNKIGGHLKRMTKPLGVAGKAAGGLGKGFKLLGGGLMGLTGGPLGLLMIALPFIVKFLTDLYKKSPAFRKFVDTIVEKLKEFGKWAAKIMNEYVIPALDQFFQWVNKVVPPILKWFGKMFKAIWGGAQTVFGWLKKHWRLIVGIMLGPIVYLVLKVIQHWDDIKAAAKKLVDKVKERFQDFKDKINDLRDAVGRGVQKIKDFFGGIGDKIHDFVQGAKDKWDEFRKNLGTFRDRVGDVVDRIKGFFGSIKESISNAFNGGVENVKKGLNVIIDFINNKFVGRANKVLGKVGLEMKAIPRLATGGIVPGSGGPTADDRLVAASSGEYVVRTAAARSVGYDVMNKINQSGQIPGSAVRGASGLSQADRELLMRLIRVASERHDEQIIVNPSQGMNELELAHKVARTRITRRGGR